MRLRPILSSILFFSIPSAAGTGASLTVRAPNTFPLSIGDRFAGDQIHFFTVDWRRAAVLNALERSGLYRELILKALEEEGLPPELFFLPMVESEYSASAVSWAGAAGLWQLMPETARLLGLEVSKVVDERLDPVKSTRAALRLLKELRTEYGDWSSALAAYNCGRSVLNATLSGRRASFPKETRLYVPRFAASVKVGRNPGKYGYRPEYKPPMMLSEREG